MTLALAVALVVLVPRLEAEAEAAVGPGASLLASATGLPSLGSGLVEFERTEDVDYIVVEGETLSEIARKFRIDYETLARFNGLRDPNSIIAGQQIVIPGSTSRLLRTEEK